MKNLTITLLASLSLAVASFGGQEIYSGKDSKKTVLPETTCFKNTELQLDVFGAYSIGEGPEHAGPIRDHGWGGGIGVNYFFSRYIGVGAEGYWLDAKTNGAQTKSDDTTTFHNISGSVIFRLPIDSLCIAPYTYLGGGVVVDGEDWAVGFAGVGLEFRVLPNKVGIFVDGRWNYFGDRFGNGDQNSFTSRVGMRWIF